MELAYSAEISSLDDVSNALIFKDPKNKFERYINACSVIPKIVQIYNEGDVPDWSDTNQYKYVPCRYLSGGVWLVDSDWSTYPDSPGSFYFVRKEDSDDALKRFITIYDDFWNG